MTFQEHIGFICIRASPAYKQKVVCKLHTHYRVVGLNYSRAKAMVRGGLVTSRLPCVGSINQSIIITDYYVSSQ